MVCHWAKIRLKDKHDSSIDCNVHLFLLPSFIAAEEEEEELLHND